MRNATNAPADFVAWAAGEAAHSARFPPKVDRLRALAAGETRAGYPRTTGPLNAQPWPTLEQILAHSSRLAQHLRPYAWANTEHPTSEGLRHLRDYLRGCRKVGREFLGHPDTASLVHQLVRATGYQVIVPTTISPAAPTGPAASNLAAHITGASWGAGATAHRQTWRRARPANLDTFLLD